MTTENLGDAQAPGGPERRRRIALLPLVLIVAGVLAAIVFAVVVAALATSATGGSAPAESASPSIPAPPPVDAAPSAAPRPTAGPNECVDERGDGAPIDVDSAALSIDGDRLRVVLVLADELPEGDSELVVVAQNTEGVTYELVSSWVSGELDDFFAESSGADPEDGSGNGRGNDQGDRDDDKGDDKDDKGDGKEGDSDREDLRPRDIANEGTVIIATFPRSVLRTLGGEFDWYVVASAGGVAADSCPGRVQPDGSLAFRP